MSLVENGTHLESGVLRFSAPGKTILFGEHAVVYGKTAVAGAIGLRTTVELKFRPPAATNGIDDQIELSLPDLNFCRSFPRRKLLEAADKLEQQCREENEPDDYPPSPELAVPLAQEICGPFTNDRFDANGGTPSKSKYSATPAHIAMLTFVYVLLGVLSRRRDIAVFKLKVSSKVPIRVGLGSSGAYCVTMCTALLRLADLIDSPSLRAPESDCESDGLTWCEEDLHMIELWSTAAESLIHGRSSGLDASICTRGGLITYRLGERPEKIGTCVDLRAIIVNTKVERNTLQMIRTVKENMEKFPEVIQRIFDSIDEISIEAARLLTNPISAKSNTSSPLSIKKLQQQQPNGDGKILNGHSPINDDNGNNGISETNGTSETARNGTMLSLTNGFNSLRTGSASVGITDNNYALLQELCRINNHLLNALGVGHAKITQICSLLARYGIHTKLSGAGGGGTVFAFITRDASPTLVQMIEKELDQLGFELWQPDLGAAGVQQHIQ